MAKNGMSLDDVVVHLLHRVSQRADDMFAKEVEVTGLTPRQFAVLLAVARHDDPSQTDVVESTGIDRSTVAEMIRRMVKKGPAAASAQSPRRARLRGAGNGGRATRSQELRAASATRRYSGSSKLG